MSDSDTLTRIARHYARAGAALVCLCLVTALCHLSQCIAILPSEPSLPQLVMYGPKKL